MSITPLDTVLPSPVVAERQSPHRDGESAFDRLLDRLQSGLGSSRSEEGAIAAELLRIEMMQNTLSLSDDGFSSPAAGSPVLSALCSRLAESGHAARALPPAETAAASVSPAATGDGVVRTASRFLGIPYRFGGDGPTGIDCSSLVQQVYRAHGVALPRTALEQSRVGTEVAAGDLRKGDLLFFHTYASYPSHVGIYLGDGKMIHASSGSGKVVVAKIDSAYFRSRFICARRVT